MNQIRIKLKESLFRSSQQIIIIVITTILISFLSIMLNIFFSQSFYKAGINYIHQYQQLVNNSFFTYLNNIVSMLLNTHFTGILLILYFFIETNKLRVFTYIINFFFNIFLISILKNAYYEARPFWSSKQILSLQWYCQLAFGNPSGHSWMVFTFYENMSYVYGTKIYPMNIVLLLILTIGIPISRTYLGQHSSDQIVMGMLCGICNVLMYRLLFQQKYHSLLLWLNSAKKTFGFILIITFNVIIFILPIIVYLLINPKPKDLNWHSNVIDKCGQNVRFQPQKIGLTSSAITSIIPGIMIVAYISSANNFQLFYTFKFKYVYKKWTVKAIMLGFILLILILSVLPFFLIYNLVKMHVILEYFIMFLGLELGVIVSLFVTPLIMKHLKFIYHDISIKGNIYLIVQINTNISK